MLKENNISFAKNHKLVYQWTQLKKNHFDNHNRLIS